MCGITGYIDKRGPVDSARVGSMMANMVHRGPDDEGQHIHDRFALGFRRLSIIDLSTGSQPIPNEDESCWLVCNGEIYNYKDLRAELEAKGHRFRTNTDVEVIVHLYEEYGTELLSRLRGMFGFVILDKEKELLFGARDHFGIKPLYYLDNRDYFAFASEAKCLVPLVDSQEVDTEAFLTYLTFQYVPAPMTIFKGMRKLPKAHYFVVNGEGDLRVEKYWSLQFDEEEKSFEEYTAEVRAVLEESVRLHKQSDVPVGTFLSGGVDSSTVTALLSKLQPVKSFSVGYDREKYGRYSELDQAQDLAKHLGIDWHYHVITPDEYWDTLNKAIWHLDEPLADASAISLYFVAQIAAEHVKVVLTGEGADELFGGYRVYHQAISLGLFNYMPPGLRQWLGRMALRLPEGMKGRNYLLRGSKALEERFVGNANIFSEEQKEAAVALDGWQGRHPTALDFAQPYYNEVADQHDITKMQYVDINLWLPDEILTKADRMSMAHSLELRVPFLDLGVADVARRIPPRYRVTSRGQTKHVLREAVKDLMPEETVNRTKLGFPVPIRVWLKDEFYDRVKGLFMAPLTERFFNRSYLITLLDDHKNGIRDNSRLIWVIVTFLIWYRQYRP